MQHGVENEDGTYSSWVDRPQGALWAGPGAPTLWDAVDSECVIELPERYSVK